MKASQDALLKNPLAKEPFIGRTGGENDVAAKRFYLAFQLKSLTISNENLVCNYKIYSNIFARAHDSKFLNRLDR